MKKRSHNVADELYKVAKLGMEASELVMPSVQNEALKQEIKNQERDYAEIGDSSEMILLKNGCLPTEKRRVTKNMLRNSVKINLMFNKTPQHISEMMINGTVMGILDITKTINHSPDDDPESHKLAEEYLDREQKNIENLKKYL